MSYGPGRFAIYPEERFWTESKIRMALSDAIANGDVGGEEIEPDTANTVPLETACNLLSDTGKVTWQA